MYTPEQLLGFHAFAKNQNNEDLAKRVFIEALNSHDFNIEVHISDEEQNGYYDEVTGDYYKGHDIFDCLPKGHTHLHRSAFLALEYNGNRIGFRIHDLSKAVVKHLCKDLKAYKMVLFKHYFEAKNNTPSLPLDKEALSFFNSNTYQPFRWAGLCDIIA